MAMLPVLMAGPVRSAAPRPEVPLATTTRSANPRPDLFSFHSNFWLNLHHFLYVTARARKGLDARRPAVTSALSDTAGFGALPESSRNEWEAAVAYYDSAVASRDILFDSGMVTINNRLASADSASSLGGSGLDPSLIATLESAAPVYRRLWWPRHDAANRRWTARMRELLALHGDSLAAWESRALREPWPSTPVRVDVTAYSNWAGAYTTSGPSHITVSSESAGNQDDQGLEILFHEVLHTMDDSLRSSLTAAFRAHGKTLPRDPTHTFIFYTAGALTQRAIPAHAPYGVKNGLWGRVPDFRRALPLLQRIWQPYLDGKTTFDEAIRQYAAEF